MAEKHDDGKGGAIRLRPCRREVMKIEPKEGNVQVGSLRVGDTFFYDQIIYVITDGPSDSRSKKSCVSLGALCSETTSEVCGTTARFSNSDRVVKRLFKLVEV